MKSETWLDSVWYNKTARVFPRRTKATPTDRMAFIGMPDLFTPQVNVVHISVTFTWDKLEAHRLAEYWSRYGQVMIGGPAMGTKGEEFTPGKYLKEGYVITSRGCPNHCWFCNVWRREGDIRELPITEGWNVLDDNLLACSEKHIRKVFAMLRRQPKRAVFSGGLEAHRLQDWHIDLLVDLNPAQIFFAYDTPNDYEPLIEAGRRLNNAGFTIGKRKLYCYVLIGYPGDTFEGAEKRCRDALFGGFIPFAMLYRDESGKTDHAWRKFQRSWCRPAAIMSRCKANP